jgi:hypothetical protein
VDTPVDATKPLPVDAHLMVYSKDHQRDIRLLSVAGIRRMMRRWLKASTDVPQPFHLQIEDLQGRTWVHLVDATPTLDIRLPAGVYRVKAEFGTTQRSYTLVLARGASFDLHIPRTEHSIA